MMMTGQQLEDWADTVRAQAIRAHQDHVTLNIYPDGGIKRSVMR